MCKAIDVTKRILYVAQTNGDLITNLKMQKLLYYAQAWFMVNNNKKVLFDDEIQAWQFGPIVPSVYNKLKKFKYNPISMDLSDENWKSLSKKQTVFIEDFCKFFFKFSATELVSMSHNETPWKEAFKKGQYSKISEDSMYEYYSNLLKKNEEK